MVAKTLVSLGETYISQNNIFSNFDVSRTGPDASRPARRLASQPIRPAGRRRRGTEFRDGAGTALGPCRLLAQVRAPSPSLPLPWAGVSLTPGRAACPASSRPAEVIHPPPAFCAASGWWQVVSMGEDGAGSARASSSATRSRRIASAKRARPRLDFSHEVSTHREREAGVPAS